MNEDLRQFYIEGIMDLLKEIDNVNIIGGLYVCCVEGWKKSRRLQNGL